MRALISVSDKTGIVEFAQEIDKLGFEIVSTGGTSKVLKEAGLDVKDISDITGFPEMMDGRVKTLHPRVHGGLLALRSNPEHMAIVKQHDIGLIDLVVVNLYPFEKTVAKPDVTQEDAIENIDIGGPSMLRSAAKNFESVGVVTDPADYEKVISELKDNGGKLTAETKFYLAKKVFVRTAEYDLAIATFLNPCPLRYGENPHQKATYLGKPYQQLHGKELSFNNIIDLDAAIGMVKDFEEPAVAIIKHMNPCGAAIGENCLDAYKKALACDPVSAFGSIVSCNEEVSGPLAEEMSKLFIEVVVAPAFSEDAMKILTQKKNLRLIILTEDERRWDYKTTAMGFIAQEMDQMNALVKDLNAVTEQAPEKMVDLMFSWKICRHVKSNAIVLAKDGATIGVGAGQMSRVDALECAIKKAKEHSADKLAGCVLASDAFFPFNDVVNIAAKEGVAEIIQPGGSIRDQDSIDACNEQKVAMVFTGERHFKH
ncbi:bifunctional phosphoribosylaminoimidazolecarboxamide formyltransferase/IMP cyclohydrolase [Candidatus Margulisiibacteriota bacterium]